MAGILSGRGGALSIARGLMATHHAVSSPSAVPASAVLTIRSDVVSRTHSFGIGQSSMVPAHCLRHLLNMGFVLLDN